MVAGMKADNLGKERREAHARVLARTRQTLAVLRTHRPALRVGPYGLVEFAEVAARVGGLVEAREVADVAFRVARMAFLLGNRQVRFLSLKVPLLIAGYFQKGTAVAELLPEIWALVPRTPAVVMRRARKVLAAWKCADEALAERTPPEPPVVLGLVGVEEFRGLVEGQAGLEQAMENAASELRAGRIALRGETRSLDKVNKRFFQKLRAEARLDAAVGSALSQITTEPSGR